MNFPFSLPWAFYVDQRSKYVNYLYMIAENITPISGGQIFSHHSWLIYTQMSIYLAVIPAVFITIERNPGSNQTLVLSRYTMCVWFLGKPSKLLEHNIAVVVPVILIQLKHPDSQSLHYRICAWWDFDLAYIFQVHAASATKCLSFYNLQGCCSWSHHLSTRLIFRQC